MISVVCSFVICFGSSLDAKLGYMGLNNLFFRFTCTFCFCFLLSYDDYDNDHDKFDCELISVVVHAFRNTFMGIWC
jgi:hypothetical protein